MPADVAEAARTILATLFADVPENHDDINVEALDDRLLDAACRGSDYGMGLSYEDVVTVLRASLTALAEGEPHDR
jgi:hypothetical protein